ncbi:MAG: archease [Clostridia bacterium BRH_c25]|nr:MAG: archease [Clostridia bacterium BRH_c25]
MDLIVGIGEYAVTNNENELIKIFALASCVAVTAYDPKRKVAGMAHIALPAPNMAGEDTTRPCYYASTAVPLLINKICLDFGCPKDELEINFFGGAKSIRRDDIFNIGEKNINAVKNALNCLNLKYRAAEVGGTNSRTLEMDIATGKIKVALQPITI